jgi:hypothetical protein
MTDHPFSHEGMPDAGTTLLNALVLPNLQQGAEQLQAVLLRRAVIDQAVGILISRSGGTASEALARLQALSQSEHRKLGDVAERMLNEAPRRTRARDHGRRT